MARITPITTPGMRLATQTDAPNMIDARYSNQLSREKFPASGDWCTEFGLLSAERTSATARPGCCDVQHTDEDRQRQDQDIRNDT